MTKSITMTDEQFIDLIMVIYRRGFGDAIRAAQAGENAIDDDALKAQFTERLGGFVGKKDGE